MKYSALGIPESLRRLVGREPAANPEVFYRGRHQRGRLTASVHGNRVHVTVSLRRGWARLMDLRLTGAQIESIDRWVRRTCGAGDLFMKVCVVLAAVYLAWTIAPAFLPGGIVWQLAREVRR